ncbi:penicillin-binding protein 1B [Vibrio parahaemolyticus]|uniref:penicillin-binding protein 1B n=1 Tax=Vibrio mediterranei TaxID=689 RepID=UPI004068E9C7
MTVIKKLASSGKKPTTRKTATKQTSKSRATAGKAKRKPARKKQPKGAWRKRLFSIGWKLALVGIIAVGAVGYYLDQVVKERFEGNLFELPTVVYARVLNLSVGDRISIAQLRNELDVLSYRKVAQPRQPGEYSASSTKIELIRRPFEFADGPEPDRHVMLYFSDGALTRIQSLDKDGDLGFLRIEPKMLGMLEKQADEQRLFLRRDQFPEVMIDALLATEDRDFYQHDGVSPTAIARAFFANMRAGRTVQGGSTLTQQLAKNLFLTSDRTLWRKIREVYIALILDYRYSKDEILEAYLNEVYLGQSRGEAIHGFGLASRLYFGQPLQELRIDQLAMLVGMVKGPSYYNPIRHPERAKQRRDLVLRLMMDQGMLTGREFEMAASRNLDLQDKPQIASRQPAYFQQLKREISTKVGDKISGGKGIRIYTSLDPVSQDKLEKAIAKRLPQLEKTSGKGLEAAAVAVDRTTGEIRALVGGKRTGYSGFNRALNASRPIGSLVKPAVYLTALEQPQSYDLATTLNDNPVKLKGSKGNIWEPRNYDRKFRGDVPLYEALARSLNVPTVRLGMSLGISSVSKTLVELGVDANEIKPLPSMFLGSLSLTPYQVAQMFQTIANSGRQAELSTLRSVVTVDGDILYRSLPKSSQKVPEQAAWLTTYAMKKGVAEGTGRFLNSQFPHAALAGKTGTSNDTRDSWFVGVDGREVTTIWVGRDDNKSTKLTGSSGALRVYSDYLKARIPEQLVLPWPKEISMIGFSKTSQGALELDCGNQFELPVWDRDGSLKASCENQPKQWIKNLFNW